LRAITKSSILTGINLKELGVTRKMNNSDSLIFVIIGLKLDAPFGKMAASG
jgi:hypothetical protein